MRPTLLYIITIFTTLSSFGQIGLASGRYVGKDQSKFSYRTYIQMNAFIPFIHFNVYSKKAQYKISTKILPSFKFLWYNFNNNLVAATNSTQTLIQNDTVSTNIYKKGIFRKTSQMHTISFFLPVTFPIWFKKTKNCLYSPGLWTEYILGGNFSSKYYNNGVTHSTKNKFKSDPNFFNFNRFQYGFCMGFSYKFLSISSIYSLVPLFNKNNNISVNRFETIIMFDIFWKRHPYMKFYSP